MVHAYMGGLPGNYSGDLDIFCKPVSRAVLQLLSVLSVALHCRASLHPAALHGWSRVRSAGEQLCTHAWLSPLRRIWQASSTPDPAPTPVLQECVDPFRALLTTAGYRLDATKARAAYRYRYRVRLCWPPAGRTHRSGWAIEVCFLINPQKLILSEAERITPLLSLSVPLFTYPPTESDATPPNPVRPRWTITSTQRPSAWCR